MTFSSSVDRDLIFRFSPLWYFHDSSEKKCKKIFVLSSSFASKSRPFISCIESKLFSYTYSIFVIISAYIYIYPWYQVTNASMEWKHDSNRGQAILASAWRLRRKIDTNDSDTESSCRSSSSLQLSGTGRSGARGSGGRWYGIDALGKTCVRGKSLQIPYDNDLNDHPWSFYRIRRTIFDA